MYSKFWEEDIKIIQLEGHSQRKKYLCLKGWKTSLDLNPHEHQVFRLLAHSEVVRVRIKPVTAVSQ